MQKRQSYKSNFCISFSYTPHTLSIHHLYTIHTPSIESVLAYDLGNKLLNVTDTTNYSTGFDDGNNHETTHDNDFEYDTYGNLIIDRNKGITEISYNHLNLPKKITFGTQGTMTYLYDATGQKLKKTMTEGTNLQNTEYLDGFQYTQEALDFFPHQEGYVKVVSAQGVGGSSSFNYVFTYTDHLGNIRLRYTKTETQGLAILEEDHYYPFGLKHNGYNSDHKIFEFNDGTNTVVLTPVTPSRKETYKYKFNGIELQDEFDLNMYAMDLRMYDPAIARWVVQDPVVHFDYSTYSAFDNNPVFWADPSGANSQSLIQDLWDSTPEGTDSYWTNSNSDDNEDDQEQPKYQFFGISSTGDMMNLRFDGEFNMLTGFGEDPQELRKAKVSSFYNAFKGLKEADKMKVLRKLKIPMYLAKKIAKAPSPASLAASFVNARDDGFAAVPVFGGIFDSFNADFRSDGRLIENMNMWDAVRGGYSALMDTKILNDVIIIYSNVNLYNQSTINTNESEALDSRQPTGKYKYAYFGTQYGENIYIFGFYELD